MSDDPLVRTYAQALRDGGMPEFVRISDAVEMEICRQFGIGKHRKTVHDLINAGWLEDLRDMAGRRILTPESLARCAARRTEASRESAA